MNHQVAIIKYPAGNIQSVEFALQRLRVQPIISDDPKTINSADKVIFPGVGAAPTAMDHLVAGGLDRTIKSLRQPVLGICLGLQLLCQHSDEGDTNGIG